MPQLTRSLTSPNSDYLFPLKPGSPNSVIDNLTLDT